MYICICNPVTDTQIRACVSRGVRTLPELQAELGVALQCGMCASAALAIVDDMTLAADDMTHVNVSANDTGQLQAAA